MPVKKQFLGAAPVADLQKVHVRCVGHVRSKPCGLYGEWN